MHHRRAQVLSALIVACALMLPSCSEPAGPGREAVTIAVDTAFVSALETISLRVTGARAGDSFVAQIDLSGTTRFAESDLIEVPVFERDGVLTLAAPNLDVADRTSATRRYDLRVRRGSDDVTSNSVMLLQRTPPATMPTSGLPTGILDLVLRGLFSTSDARMAQMGSKLGLSIVFDTAESMGHDTAPLDEMAVAVLDALFDPAESVLPASIDRAVLGPIRDGMARVGACLEDLMSETSGSLAGAAAMCSTTDLDAALRVVWEGSAGSIVDVFERLARVANTGASLLTRPLSGATQVTEVLAHRAYLSNLVQRSGTLALYANEYGRTNDLTPFVEYGLREGTRVYLVGQLDDFTHVLYDFLNGDQLLDHVADLTPDLRQDAITLEEELTTAVETFLEDQNTNPDIYGGTDDVPGIDEELEWIAEGCASPEDLVLPDVTCARFLEGLEDPEIYARFVPMMLQLSDHLEYVAGPPCTLDPELLTCKAALEAAEDLMDDLAALFNERGIERTCTEAYAAFDSSDPRFETCIHSSLVVASNGPVSCNAGSYAASSRGLDVGDAHVCVLYSRDYFQPDGTCREGYRETFFAEERRCRWSGLSDAEEVAFTIDKESGRRTTLIR